MIPEKTAYFLFIIKNLIYLEKALSIDYNINVNRVLSRLNYQTKIYLKWDSGTELKLKSVLGLSLKHLG